MAEQDREWMFARTDVDRDSVEEGTITGGIFVRAFDFCKFMRETMPKDKEIVALVWRGDNNIEIVVMDKKVK
jgi:hypothetical protein